MYDNLIRDFKKGIGLVSTLQIFTKDFGMEFGMKKFDVLVLKRRKAVSSEGVEMSNGERIIEVVEDRYKYLCVLQYNTIKESPMKENFWRQCMRKNGINHERYTQWYRHTYRGEKVKRPHLSVEI